MSTIPAKPSAGKARIAHAPWRAMAGVCLAAVLAAPAADFLPLKVRLYDHNYGDFNTEFGTNANTECKYLVDTRTTGMLQDTLIFDDAKGKKIPRRGSKDFCSANIEKWFDPATSRINACQNFFLKNTGPAARPLWQIDVPDFNPADTLGGQKTYVMADGNRLNHDFAFCMELNAGVILRGGETMKFRSDDDLWVFLDNRLVVDLGGMHTSIENSVNLDTLSFLAGKQGKNLDFDLYYCGRRPITSVFGMETNLDLKPLPLKDLRIVDTLGKAVTSKDIIVGKTRLCARAFYQLPGEEACGNYKTPPDLTFLSADWDLNGLPLFINGGQSCLDLDPMQFPHGTKINITAKAEGKLARITLTLYRLARPKGGLLSGNGRAEEVRIDLDSASGPAPDGLEAFFDFSGVPKMVIAEPREGTWILRGNLSAGERGPLGISGFAPIPAVTRQYLFRRMITMNVALRDGVSPILTAARLEWSHRRDGSTYLELDVSEELGPSPGLAVSMLRAKRGSTDLELADVLRVITPVDPCRFRFSLDPNLAANLRAGDSLSLGAAADRAGNPAKPYFVAVTGPAHLQGALGRIRFQDNPAVGKAFDVDARAGGLVLVDAGKTPIRDHDMDRRVSASGGPVLIIPALAPLRKIQLQFYDHLGGFVDRAEREITPQEWDLLRKDSPGDTTMVRLMWYPVSARGRKLGTGVYVAKGRVWTADGMFVPGDEDRLTRVRGDLFTLKPTLFGYIRN